MSKQYAILNYGCQMNESDAEHYAGQLQELGYTPVADFHVADVILVNTCCVRESAEKKIAGKIGELKAVKVANPNVVICVAGCMAQKDGEKLLKKYPQIDLVIGTSYINSFGKLFRDYYARITGYICRLLKNKEVAEDIAQNTFVKFWINRGSLDPSKSAVNLLYVMARNAALDYLRSRYSSSVPLSKDVAEQAVSDTRPDEVLEMKDRMQKIEGSISSLPPQRQLVFRMSRYFHMTNKEIAEQLNISEATVRKHIELAKKDLKNDFS